MVSQHVAMIINTLNLEECGQDRTISSIYNAMNLSNARPNLIKRIPNILRAQFTTPLNIACIISQLTEKDSPHPQLPLT